MVRLLLIAVRTEQIATKRKPPRYQLLVLVLLTNDFSTVNCTKPYRSTLSKFLVSHIKGDMLLSASCGKNAETLYLAYELVQVV
jgi:hypothetical protein